MNVTRYQPWAAVSGNFQNEMKHVFDRLLNSEDNDQSNIVTSQWLPKVDIKEETKRFVIFADIPGVDPKEIEIAMDKGILSIRGERKIESSESDGKFSRNERAQGLFYRRFALPDSADAEGINAVGKNGVLEISIPKKPESTPRRIPINS